MASQVPRLGILIKGSVEESGMVRELQYAPQSEALQFLHIHYTVVFDDSFNREQSVLCTKMHYFLELRLEILETIHVFCYESHLLFSLALLA